MFLLARCKDAASWACSTKGDRKVRVKVVFSRPFKVIEIGRGIIVVDSRRVEPPTLDVLSHLPQAFRKWK